MPPSLRPGAQGPTGELPPSLRPGAPNALDRNERLRNAANTILNLVDRPEPPDFSGAEAHPITGFTPQRGNIAYRNAYEQGMDTGTPGTLGRDDAWAVAQPWFQEPYTGPAPPSMRPGSSRERTWEEAIRDAGQDPKTVARDVVNRALRQQTQFSGQEPHPRAIDVPPERDFPMVDALRGPDIPTTGEYDRSGFTNLMKTIGSEAIKAMDVFDQTFYDITGARDPITLGRSIYDLARGETTPGFLEPIQDSPTVQNIRDAEGIGDFYDRQGEAFADAPLSEQIGRGVFSPQNLIGGGLATRGIRAGAEALGQTGRSGQVGGRVLGGAARVNEALDNVQARYGPELLGGLAGGIAGGVQGGDAEDIAFGAGLGIVGGRAGRRAFGRGQAARNAPIGLETDDVGRVVDFNGDEIRAGDEVTPRGSPTRQQADRVESVNPETGTVRTASGQEFPASQVQRRPRLDEPIPKPDGPDEIENAAQSVRTVQERADDIFRSLMPHERKNVNTQARGALRRYEGAVSHAANKTQIAVQDGTDKLKSANINPDERSEEMVELFRALHNETEPPPRLRNIYNDLKEMVAAEEARSVVGDPKFVPIDEDYFFRGWRRIEVPGDKVSTQGMGRGTFGRTQAYQRHRSDMGFSELLDTTFRDEDGYYRLEPVTWNPYKMAGIRNLMGVESREQQAILQGFREAGIVRDAPLGPPPQGWKVPDIGLKTERVMMPRQVADLMESIWGKPVDLGEVAGVDVANFINRLSTGLKRWKLFGSLFQQADFATRNGFGGFAGALEALQQGKPLRAAKNLAGVPPDIANLVIANASPQRRRKLLREMSSNKQVIPDSDVTWADLQQGALSVEDISIMKRNFAGELKNLAREGSAKGSVEQALNRVGSIERAHQAGLFDGVYPQAIKNTMERLIMPYVERVYGDLPRAQKAAEAAKLSNEMFSTLPLTQQGLRNPYLRWTARQLIFSTNETESFLRQGSGLIKGGNQGIWRKFYLGGFLFLAALADSINYAVTGEHLKPEQFSPVKRDRYSPFGFGYNSKFLSPVIGNFGPAASRVNLDLMGQMDTIFSFIEDPVTFFTNRTNIIPGQIMDQVKGEDFYGRNFVEGSDLPHSIDNRVRHALTEAGFPIGLGHIMEGIRQRADLDFIAPGDRRVGETGSYIQGTGLNLRGESNRDLKNRSVREWAEENNIVGPGGQPVTSLDDIRGEPALIQQWREATPRIQEELERRGDVAIERGADYSESIERRRTNERFKGRARQRQIRIDESLKTGEIDWGQWDQVHDDIRNDLRAQQDVIYENAQTPEEKDVLDRYYAKIEELQDPVTEEVPWEKVEAWKQTALSRSERNKLERNTGLGKKTDAEKTWANRAEYVSKSGYWDIDDEIAQRIASENPEVPDSIATRQELEEHIRGQVHDAMRSEGRDPTSPNNKPFVDEWTWNAIDRLVDPNEPNAFRKWSQNARETMRERDTQLHLVLLLTGWKTPNEEEREWLASLSEEQINEYLDQGLRLNRDSDPQSLGGIFRQAAREASETVTSN